VLFALLGSCTVVPLAASAGTAPTPPRGAANTANVGARTVKLLIAPLHAVDAVLRAPSAIHPQEAIAATSVALALGAQLPEPDTASFFDTLWLGGDVTVGLEATTGATGLLEIFEDAGFGVRLTGESADPAVQRAVRSVTPPPGDDLRLDIVVSDQVPNDVGFDGTADLGTEATFVFGVERTAPVLIARVGSTGLLDPDRSGLPGLVSPYDLTRQVAAAVGITVDASMPGAGIGVAPRTDALEHVRALRTRLVEDLEWRKPVSVTSVALVIVACIIGLAVAMRRGSLRVARSAGGLIIGAFAGSLAAILLPLGGAPLRLVVVALCGIAGALMPIARTYGIAALAMFTTLSVLTVVAAARGHGEPALSLWPSPLEASRASGLLNGYVVLIVGSLLTLTALGWGSRLVRGAAATVAIVLIGAPQLGANYGGVVLAVVAFAATAAIQRAGKLRVRDLAIVGALGLVVLIGALALDIGGQTHGGRLLDTFREDGIGVIGDVLRGRWETSAVVTGRFGMIAWIGFWLMLPILVVTLVGVIAPRKVPLLERVSMRTRAVVGGLVLAAFTALVLEDTGFLTAGSLLGFIVALVLFDVTPPPMEPSRVPARMPTGAPA
jgi:hypothetical protein